MTRQRESQKRKRKAGLCERCSEKLSNKTYCKKHAKEHAERMLKRYYEKKNICT